jgi:hypothetical protein
MSRLFSQACSLLDVESQGHHFNDPKVYASVICVKFGITGIRLLEKVKGRFITQQGLHNLSQYKYSGEDDSLIYKYLVDPFAKALCNCLPRTIAPNVLTLLGLLCSAAACINTGTWF